MELKSRLAWLLLGVSFPSCAAFSIDAGFTCRASSNEYACSFALDRNLTSAWASDGGAPQWLEARIADGTYATLGSYALTAVRGRPDLAPTAWRLEGVEPGTDQRTILDEAYDRVWHEGTTHVRELAGISSWRSYMLTALAGTGTQVAIAEIQLMPKLGYAFEISHWTTCSVTCGGGTQERTVVCRGEDGVSYADIRCTTGEPPVRSRACGTAICACQGGVACSATCASSSAATADLGCGVLLDGAIRTAWTSAGPAPQWLEFDLGKVRELEAFSLTAGECTACTSLQGPSIISLQATSTGSGSRGWLELRTPFTVGMMWSSGETRRWNLGDGSTAFRYWRFNFLETFGGGPHPVHVAEVGLYAVPSTYRLVIGGWGSCEPLGGSGACGLGASRRSVTCFDDEDYPHPVELCENGPETTAVQGCNVDCPELVVSRAFAHPDFFGIMRVELTSQWAATVRCAAFKAPMGAWEPSSSDLDVTSYAGIGASDSNNGTADVEGIQVDAFAGEEFEVRCKVVGGSQTFGRGRRAILRPVPTLMGCYADRPADPDLPEDRGGRVQVSCADACFGYQYFGLQLRGQCACGDTYGQYGEQKPNFTAGIPGCDCNGPYYAYHANCVWEQTSGRFGQETMLPLQSASVTTTSAEMFAAVDKDTRLRCNVSAEGISAIPRTSAFCTSRGCTLTMSNLVPSTTYTVSCEAEADAWHRSKRLAVLLVRTLDPAVPPATMAPTRAPLDLTEPEYAMEATPAPIVYVAHGQPPWEWMPLVAAALASLSLVAVLQCCRGKNSGVLEALELPHTFWLIWELVLVVDSAFGLIFLLDLLHTRYERQSPYWDELSLLQAAVLLYFASVHGLAFLFFGFFPAALRCLAFELWRDRPAHQWTLLRYKGMQHRTGVSKAQKSALPPELDGEQNPAALHYLPPASLLAVCTASERDVSRVAPKKVGINSCHLSASAVQAACAAYYASHSWPMQVSLGASAACMCTCLVMGVILSLMMIRARQVKKEGLVQFDARLEEGSSSQGLRATGQSSAKGPLPPRVGLQGPSKGPRPLGKAQFQHGRT